MYEQASEKQKLTAVRDSYRSNNSSETQRPSRAELDAAAIKLNQMQPVPMPRIAAKATASSPEPGTYLT
jgi:hypothetical protein